MSRVALSAGAKVTGEKLEQERQDILAKSLVEADKKSWLKKIFDRIALTFEKQPKPLTKEEQEIRERNIQRRVVARRSHG